MPLQPGRPSLEHLRPRSSVFRKAARPASAEAERFGIGTAAVPPDLAEVPGLWRGLNLAVTGASDPAGGPSSLLTACGDPQNSSASAGRPPTGLISGRQREHGATPGAAGPAPRKSGRSAPGCAGSSAVCRPGSVATASCMAAPSTALVEWLMAANSTVPAPPQPPHDRVRLTVSEIWCPTPGGMRAGRLGEVQRPRRLSKDLARVTQVAVHVVTDALGGAGGRARGLRQHQGSFGVHDPRSSATRCATSWGCPLFAARCRCPGTAMPASPARYRTARPGKARCGPGLRRCSAASRPPCRPPPGRGVLVIAAQPGNYRIRAECDTVVSSFDPARHDQPRHPPPDIISRHFSLKGLLRQGIGASSAGPALVSHLVLGCCGWVSPGLGTRGPSC